MLVHLQIRDFAIIDSVELELASGLTALTGETGAGKSIIVDAVMLAIGGRASAETLRHGAERAEITATFDVKGDPRVRRWLEEQSLADDSGEIVLRRVIGVDGRSRQYVNGQTLPAQAVRDLGEFLIDIHGQQEFQSLVRRDTQRNLVDEHGDHGKLLEPVQSVAVEWRRLTDERQALAEMARDRGSRIELLRYQAGELEALNLAEGEVASLLDERSRLANRGRLAEAARNAIAFAFDADGADAHALAARAVSQLRNAAALDPRLGAPLRMLEEAVIALGESGSARGAYLEALDADPARQEFVERRVAALEDLARKHRVPPQQLPRQLNDLRQQLATLEQSELVLGDLEQRVTGIRTNYRVAAGTLSARRRMAAKRLASPKRS